MSSSFCLFFFFKQKTAYEMRISDWSSDVCSSDLRERNKEYDHDPRPHHPAVHRAPCRDQPDRHRRGPHRPPRLRARAPPPPHHPHLPLGDASHQPHRLPLSDPCLDRNSTRLNSSQSCASRMPYSSSNTKQNIKN